MIVTLIYIVAFIICFIAIGFFIKYTEGTVYDYISATAMLIISVIPIVNIVFSTICCIIGFIVYTNMRRNND